MTGQAAAGTAAFMCPADASGSCSFAVFEANGTEGRTFSLQPGMSGRIDVEAGDRYCSTTGESLDLATCVRRPVRGIEASASPPGNASLTGASAVGSPAERSPARERAPAKNGRALGQAPTSRSVAPVEVTAGIAPRHRDDQAAPGSDAVTR